MTFEENFDITVAGKKISFAADVDGDFYVSIYTDNSTSCHRANIDNLDIVLATSVKRELVSTITTSATSYAFNNLEEGAIYLYRVKASDGDAYSDYSDYMEVALLPTGIDEIVADGDWCEVYAVVGVKVYCGDKAGMPTLSKGVYVIVTASGVHKVLVE